MTQATQDNETADNADGPASKVQNGGRLRDLSRRKLIGLVAGLFIAVVVFSVPYYLHSLLYESTDDAFIDGDIVPISPRVSGHMAKVYVVDNQRVKAGDLLAELDPKDFQTRLAAALSALESAKAEDRARQAGVDLTKITASARLNEAKAGVEAARAAVKSAMAQARAVASKCDQTKAQIDLSRAAMEQAMAGADAAKAVYQRDSTDLKRYQEMARAKVVSKQELDHAMATEQMSEANLRAAEKKIETQKAMLRQAKASSKAARDNLQKADAQIIAYRAQLDQAKANFVSAQSVPQQIKQSQSQAEVSIAEVAKAKAEVAQARLNLSYTKIYAPVSGFVTKKAVEPGQSVETAQSLMAIVPKGVWVRANFKETQLTRMHPGQPVKITVDAYPDRTFHGHVDSIQHGSGARFSLLPPENATGNFVKVVQRVPVKIVFDQPKEISKVLLAPGMSVLPEVNVGAAP